MRDVILDSNKIYPAGVHGMSVGRTFRELSPRQKKRVQPASLSNKTRTGRVVAAILAAQGGLTAVSDADAAFIQRVDQIRGQLIAYHFPSARSAQGAHPSLSQQAGYWPNWNSWRNCYGFYGWLPRTDRRWRWPIR